MEPFRPRDPRFRRRINELGASLEHANEAAQSGIYIFGQEYVKPCLHSVGACFTTCFDASCPTLNLTQRDRLRRQRGRTRGRAELSFDFYDDWDEQEENDGLLGWGGGSDDFDGLLSSGGRGYGTLANAQPARQRGMSYPKARRKSAGQPHDGGPETPVIPGNKGWLASLFGGKALRYQPSAAGLQEHPGARRPGTDQTEGEALLGDDETGRRHKGHTRKRSSTASSGETTDSLSSRGDLFPSDEENDAIPLDDEFAMVLERRTTQTGGFSAPETESSSGKTRSQNERRRGKRPSAGSRTSTRRTASSRSTRSSTGKRVSGSRRGSSSAAQTPIEEDERAFSSSPVQARDETVTITAATIAEMKLEDDRVAAQEEDEVERRRDEARKLAAERGLARNDDEPADVAHNADELSSKEATPHATRAASVVSSEQPTAEEEEPSQLPTPVPTDDEEDEGTLEHDHATRGGKDGGAV